MGSPNMGKIFLLLFLGTIFSFTLTAIENYDNIKRQITNASAIS